MIFFVRYILFLTGKSVVNPGIISSYYFLDVFGLLQDVIDRLSGSIRAVNNWE